MGCSVKFWDLDYALKCVQGSEATAEKLRKAELIRAISALTWFVRGLPQGVPLLQEVRSLAGRVQDGLDTPGKDYTDHPLSALRAQPELKPYTYSAAMVRAGASRAGPPQHGHIAAHSFVPDEVLSGAGGAGAGGAAWAARTAAAAAGEVAAAVEAMAGASQGQAQGGDSGEDSGTRTAVLAAAAIAATEKAAAAAAALAAAASQDTPLFTQEDAEHPSGGGDVDHVQGKVSAPAVNDDLAQDGFVDGSDLTPKDGAGDEAGYVRAPAAIDPLVAVGSTVGRGRAGQSQVQVGSQVQAQADKKKLCKSVWRDDVCRDKDCDRAHPPRCGDPRCFPWRRRACQHWHRAADTRKEQGNGSSAGPGRAERGQVQGSQQPQQRPLRRRCEQPQGAADRHQRQHQRQQLLRQHQPHPRGGRQQQQQQPAQRQQQQQRLHQQQRQQRQQEMPSYRDVALRGIPSLNNGGSFHNDGSFLGSAVRGHTSGGFGPGQPDPAALSTVVAAVMAVLAGRTQPF